MKKNTIITFVILFFIPLVSYFINAQVIGTAPPLFQNGFESPTWIEQNYETGYYNRYSYGDFHNPDNNTNYPSNWDEDLEDLYSLGNFEVFTLYYVTGTYIHPISGDTLPDGGTKFQRLAEIVPDPDPDLNDPNNMVLSTWASEGYGSKNLARVQPSWHSVHYGLNDKNGSGYEILHYSVKFYLPEHFQDFADDLNFQLNQGHLTIIQLWNDFQQSQAKPGYKLNTAIQKQAGNNYFSFASFGTGFYVNDTTGATIKESIVPTVFSDVEIPISQWNTMDVYFKEGDENNGYFRIKLNGATAIEINDWTHHPNNDTPDGLTFIDPFELYVDNSLIAPMAANGDRVEIYWDNFTIYSDSKLKQKFIKIVSPAQDTVITNSNLTLSARYLEATTAGIGLDYDWEYIFYIANRNDPNNIIWTPGQKSRHLDLTPYRDSGALRDGASYRAFTAVRNHPFLYQYGAWPDFHMDFTTNFSTLTKNNNKDAIKIYPNPTKMQFSVDFIVKNDFAPTLLYLTNKNNTILHKLELGIINKGLHTETIDISSLGIREEIIFLHIENGEHRIAKKVLIE